MKHATQKIAYFFVIYIDDLQIRGFSEKELERLSVKIFIGNILQEVAFSCLQIWNESYINSIPTFFGMYILPMYIFSLKKTVILQNQSNCNYIF